MAIDSENVKSLFNFSNDFTAVDCFTSIPYTVQAQDASYAHTVFLQLAFKTN